MISNPKNESPRCKRGQVEEGVGLQKGVANGGAGFEGGGKQYQITGGKENVVYE